MAPLGRLQSGWTTLPRVHDQTTSTSATASTLQERRGYSVELGTAESLAERPAAGSGVVGEHGAAVAGGDPEGEGLPVQERVALPVLAPVARQGLPPGGALGLHGNRVHVAGASHVGHQHKVEVGVAVDGETYATLLVARNPAEHKQAQLSDLLGFFPPCSAPRAKKPKFTKEPVPPRTCGRRREQCRPCRARCAGTRAATCRSGRAAGCTSRRRRRGARCWAGISWWPSPRRSPAGTSGSRPPPRRSAPRSRRRS
jgi:hypothetical protein